MGNQTVFFSTAWEISPPPIMARTPRSCNTTNNISITLEQTGPPIPKVIPKCMVINARSLAKPDAAVSLNVELCTK